jgi:hypothetical protein
MIDGYRVGMVNSHPQCMARNSWILGKPSKTSMAIHQIKL